MPGHGGLALLQFLLVAMMYASMVFIWSYVYLNKSHDKINESFLAFLSVILVWMLLSASSIYSGSSLSDLILKTVYWISMLNLAIFFLQFVYRLLKKKLDWVFYSIVALNTLTILSRYLFPIDYSDPTFWRMDELPVAPLMSFIFSVPALYALLLIAMRYRRVTDPRLKVQINYICAGIGLALVISVFSEYILPSLFHINIKLSLMYFAIFIFVSFLFISIMRHRLFNLQTKYIYQKLFLNSSDGVIILHKSLRIMSINRVAKEILRNSSIETGDIVTRYIDEYQFDVNYKQHETTIRAGDEEHTLLMTQYPIDADRPDSAKLMTLTDITAKKRQLQAEKDMLIEKSVMDQLTGLYSKQYFMDNYYTIGQAEPNGMMFTLLFIDLDDFKSINDLYGHYAGDEVLKAVARCIKEKIGSGAKAVRFGGDEYVVILENTDMDKAYQLAEAIRISVDHYDFSQYGDHLSASLSIGIVEGTAPVQDLVVSADIAMYRSKHNGKNRVTIFSDSEHPDAAL
ncbi:MAG: diguanylate cyclase protein [Oscillospiraceae bacterium]|nr:diguanylate cyclase protein [Oscillospiraceae bacterium]